MARMKKQNVETRTLDRSAVEDFLFAEADCLDRWALDEWLALWAPDGRIAYEVAPTGEEKTSELDPRKAMFLIADNRFRLEQRIVRMNKNTFHAEYVRSRTRHQYTNVRIVTQDDAGLSAEFNSAVFRTKKGKSVIYPSRVVVHLDKTAEGPALRRKRIELDLDYLATMGALTILL